MGKKLKTMPYNVQVDRELLAKAKSLVYLPDAVRHLVESIVKERVCPCCGSKIKKG